MVDAEPQSVIGGKPLRRFWKSAAGYWCGRSGAGARALIGLLAICVVLQLLVQYRLNLWTRDFFNALELRSGQEIRHQAGHPDGACRRQHLPRRARRLGPHGVPAQLARLAYAAADR
ncbi:MAG: hypothetical protein NTV97_26650, partial [Alphaproteobacteria bacterium]|nr:hypothetical protein [Alphaproteobacteria bacterium]